MIFSSMWIFFFFSNFLYYKISVREMYLQITRSSFEYLFILFLFIFLCFFFVRIQITEYLYVCLVSYVVQVCLFNFGWSFVYLSSFVQKFAHTCHLFIFFFLFYWDFFKKNLFIFRNSIKWWENEVTLSCFKSGWWWWWWLSSFCCS